MATPQPQRSPVESSGLPSPTPDSATPLRRTPARPRRTHAPRHHPSIRTDGRRSPVESQQCSTDATPLAAQLIPSHLCSDAVAGTPLDHKKSRCPPPFLAMPAWPCEGRDAAPLRSPHAAHIHISPSHLKQVMEDEEKSPAMLPPVLVAPSLESMSNHKKMSSSTGIRGGRGCGRGRGSAAATVKSTAPSASISTDTVCSFEFLWIRD